MPKYSIDEQRANSVEDYRKKGDYQLKIKKNKQKAFDYYALGEKDWKDVYCRYQMALMHLEGVYMHDSTDRVEETIRLLKQNARKGHWQSCHKLGEIYSDLIYGKQNLNESLKWFQKAATCPINGSSTCYVVGDLYRDGMHFEQDYVKALIWFEQAAEQNHIDSFYFIAVIYHDGGFGVQCDIEKALKYYFKAETYGEDCTYYAEVTNALGDIYRYGEGVELNYKKAFQYYKKSATSKYPFYECMLNLSSMYSQGLGTEVDTDLAEMWSSLANENK